MDFIEEAAQQIAKIIKKDLDLVRFPTGDPIERRAICLKFAIDTKGVAFSLKNDGTISEAAQQVIDAAKIYQAYVEGETTG